MIDVAEIENNDLNDPFPIFKSWLDLAEKNEINDPNAMSMATIGQDGLPNVRIVLLKGLENNEFTFYTNIESTKGEELKNTPKAALCFHWKSIRRQVRVRGLISLATEEQADKYYVSRSRGSRIGAWASKQSRVLENRAKLEEAAEKFNRKYPDENVPRPPYWSGFCLKPLFIEFWQDGNYRLHDRILFKLNQLDGNTWSRNRLYP